MTPLPRPPLTMAEWLGLSIALSGFISLALIAAGAGPQAPEKQEPECKWVWKAYSNSNQGRER